MLKSLSIKNYALIKELEIEFDSGFVTITGETGAGKSILLGALSLILGERADSGTLLDKTKKCVVEGKFSIAELKLNKLFEQNDLDFDDETYIRREIGANGKSRAFINDTPVNLNLLKDIGSKLVDIHSQNGNLILTDLQFQLEVLDIIASNQSLLEQYKSKFNEHNNLVKKIEEIKNNALESKKEFDYLQFQFEQLNEAELVEEEQEELENELELLTHTEEIKTAFSNAFYILSEGESNINGALKEVYSLLSKITKFYEKANDIVSRLDSSIIELKDISSEIEILGESISYNPEKFQQIKDRLDLIYNLQQKHQVKTIHELIVLRNELGDKLLLIESFDDDIEKLETKEQNLYNELHKLAEKISQKRIDVIPKIEKNLLSVITKLGMPDASLKIEMNKTEKLKSNGLNEAKFLFSSNVKVEEREIGKVASGGELSRVMLAVKAIISKFKTLPTIIFDEIDSGVSGDIAYRMGDIMAQMAAKMQVISITHLAQIASKGNSHYTVYKDNSSDLPSTKMKQLNHDERITEIAKMLSGEELTNAALQNAKELLKIN